MSISRRQSIAFGLASAAACALPAVPSLAAVPRLRRGINLHHLLNWPLIRTVAGRVDYIWPPFRDAGHQIADAELALLKSAGFDFIRLTVDPSIFIASAGERWPILAEGTQALVRRLLGAGFAVIFDLHPVAVNPTYAPLALVAPGATVFDAYVEMVARVAKMLAEIAAPGLIFELMNEPWIESIKDAPRWQAMLERLHASARSTAPKLPLMLTGLAWSSAGALMQLDTRPFRGSEVFYTFHYYDPHDFTHQGVKGDDAQYLSNVPWPLERGAIPAVMERAQTRLQAAPGGEAGRQRAQVLTEKLLTDMAAKGHGPQRIAADLEAVARWADGAGIARERVVLGEFGCVVSAYGQPLGPDRLAWIRSVREAAEKTGFGWAYWAYKGYGGMELIRPGGAIEGELRIALGLSAA